MTDVQKQSSESRVAGRLDPIYRIFVLLFLAGILASQLMITSQLAKSQVTQDQLRSARSRRALTDAIPFVRVYGEVDVTGSVHVDNTVDVNVENTPVEVWVSN